MVPNIPATLGLPSLSTTTSLVPQVQFTGWCWVMLDYSGCMGWEKDGVAALAAVAACPQPLRWKAEKREMIAVL